METTRMPLVSAILSAYPTTHDQSSTPAYADLVADPRAANSPISGSKTRNPKLLKKPRGQSSAEENDRPRIVRIPELSARLGLSVSSVYVLIAKSALPKPFALVPGGRAVGWLESDVVEFVLNRKDASTKEAV
jgi:prophage regulatory protein